MITEPKSEAAKTNVSKIAAEISALRQRRALRSSITTMKRKTEKDLIADRAILECRFTTPTSSN